jgi:hypothetical protein
MGQWAPIDIADALELLSPDFLAEEVRSHAVATLQRHDDEELQYYLLQLVQALRYESADLSRLARWAAGWCTTCCRWCGCGAAWCRWWCCGWVGGWVGCEMHFSSVIA